MEALRIHAAAPDVAVGDAVLAQLLQDRRGRGEREIRRAEDIAGIGGDERREDPKAVAVREPRQIQVKRSQGGDAAPLCPGQPKAAQPGRMNQMHQIWGEFAQPAEGRRCRRPEGQLRIGREGQAGDANDPGIAVAVLAGTLPRSDPQLRGDHGGGDAALLQVIQQQAQHGDDAVALGQEGIGEEGDAGGRRSGQIRHGREGSANGQRVGVPALYWLAKWRHREVGET